MSRRFIKTFQPEFTPKIRTGSKRTTIRGFPKRASDMPREGDTLVFRQWIGKPYRSKQLKIGQAEIIRVESVDLAPHFIRISGQPTMSRPELDRHAKNDGFDSWNDLNSWFRKNHATDRFSGIIIEWDFNTFEAHE
jgi:hypothetical protein